jgi:hypothetical protein
MLHIIGEIIITLLGYFILIICLSFVAAIIDTIIEEHQTDKKLRGRWENDHKWR